MESHEINIGHINKNMQKNIGQSEFTGADYKQIFYNMECQLCGHFYFTSESNLVEGKCPKCQMDNFCET